MVSLPPDRTPEEQPWGRMEWLIDDSLQPGADLSVARMTLEAGRSGERHSHATCNEVVQVLSGKIEQEIAGKRRSMAPGETAFIPAGTLHQAHNRGREPAVLLLCYSSGRRDYRPA